MYTRYLVSDAIKFSVQHTLTAFYKNGLQETPINLNQSGERGGGWLLRCINIY